MKWSFTWPRKVMLKADWSFFVMKLQRYRVSGSPRIRIEEDEEMAFKLRLDCIMSYDYLVLMLVCFSLP